MTREEAIDVLKAYLMFDKSSQQVAKALDMAIEALHREEAEAKGYCHRIRPKDVEVVVRCKTCRHYSVEGDTTHFGWCEYWSKPTDEMRFCSIGERREE